MFWTLLQRSNEIEYYSCALDSTLAHEERCCQKGQRSWWKEVSQNFLGVVLLRMCYQSLLMCSNPPLALRQIKHRLFPITNPLNPHPPRSALFSTPNCPFQACEPRSCSIEWDSIHLFYVFRSLLWDNFLNQWLISCKLFRSPEKKSAFEKG